MLRQVVGHHLERRDDNPTALLPSDRAYWIKRHPLLSTQNFRTPRRHSDTIATSGHAFDRYFGDALAAATNSGVFTAAS